MKSRKVQLLMTLLAFGALAVALIWVVSIAGPGDESVVEIPCGQEAVAGENGDPVGALSSESEKEQLKGAGAILANPQKYGSRANQIARALGDSRFPKVRITLAKVLGKIGMDKPEANGALENALISDNHHLVRLEAARALRFAYPEGAPISDATAQNLGKALSDDEEGVALAAMRFLFEHPSKAATRTLLAYLERPEAKYRWKAVEVLGRIKDPASGPALLKILEDEKAGIPTRSRAAGVLGLIKYMPAEPVIRLMADTGSDPELAEVAKETLELFRK